MSVLVVIPARYASSRYPGKPLALLRGVSGISRPLIERTWRVAQQVRGVDRVVVATDDTRIRDVSEAFGAEVVMTSDTCANGTERCAEALRTLAHPYDLVVNIQGDAPLTPPEFVERLIAGLMSNPVASVATPVLQCDAQALSQFHQDRCEGRVGGTTAVFDHQNHALYFSKEVIPYTSAQYAAGDLTPVFHHVGIYAYRPEALSAYASQPECALEKLEGLEQLRFLYKGVKILCVRMPPAPHPFWELNNPEDVERIESALAAGGIE